MQKSSALFFWCFFDGLKGSVTFSISFNVENDIEKIEFSIKTKKNKLIVSIALAISFAVLVVQGFVFYGANETSVM